VASFSRRGGRAASSVPRPPPRSHGPARGDRDPPTRGPRERRRLPRGSRTCRHRRPAHGRPSRRRRRPPPPPRRAVPSRTMTTGSGSRDAAVAARTRSASRRVAVARSRHQPVGRGPPRWRCRSAARRKARAPHGAGDLIPHGRALHFVSTRWAARSRLPCETLDVPARTAAIPQGDAPRSQTRPTLLTYIKQSGLIHPTRLM
jgi:hypothetical protein